VARVSFLASSLSAGTPEKLAQQWGKDYGTLLSMPQKKPKKNVKREGGTDCSIMCQD